MVYFCFASFFTIIFNYCRSGLNFSKLDPCTHNTAYVILKKNRMGKIIKSLLCILTPPLGSYLHESVCSSSWLCQAFMLVVFSTIGADGETNADG